ncbi:MAG: YdcF family protein [Pseudomonadota bacterium]
MRLLGNLIGVLLLIGIGGFAVFTATLPRAAHFDLSQAQADMGELALDEIGIVALTGGGGTRIERALTLYGQNIAARVLVSGTHPEVRKEDLATTGDMSVLECCVDLGTQARTTIGNGAEARDWARTNGYSGVYLVTSGFHLPRATLELQRAAPNLTIVGVPVDTHIIPEKGWYTSRQAWRLLVGEYLKYVLTAVRTLL